MIEGRRVMPIEFDVEDVTGDEAKKYSEALVELVESTGFAILTKMIDGWAYNSYKLLTHRETTDVAMLNKAKGRIEMLEDLQANIYEQIEVAREYIREETMEGNDGFKEKS